MNRARRPEAGWPWEAAGYTFSIDWPPGFVSAIQTDRSAALSANSTAARARQLEQGLSGFGEKDTRPNTSTEGATE